MSAASFRNLQKLKKFTKNWGGRNGSNMKIVPQGPSLTRILQFSRIKNHWLPTIRGELIMKALTKKELSHILQWQRPNDWNDVIEQDAAYLASNLRYYRFEPLDVDQNSKMLTDFYLSVVLKPDHEAVINLVSSKFPYSIPALLQVAWIFTVQSSDGRTHSNDMVEKALFVFDRCFKNGILFNGVDCQLPFTFFYNRLFYLACFRHIQNLTGRGAFHTAAEWSKVLWSINPTNDPYGCRYFIDYYLILDKDYEFLIKLSRCRLFNQYEEWKTFNLTMSIIYAYYKMDMLTECKAFIHSQVLNQDNNNNNTNDSFIYLLLSFLSKLTHIDVDLDVPSNEDLNQIDIIQLALYEIRKTNSEIYTMEYINFLVAEIKGILGDMENKSKIKPYMKENDDSDATDDYFIYNIPINLIRFVVLSHESSLMAKLPTKLFDNYQLLEYDLLPPRPHTNEDAEILEDISSFIKEKDLNQYAASLLQDEDIMNRIQQLSLQEYIQQNENMAQE
ncbi:Rqc1p SCDLUD_004868 [Saccharomycodes ludwigii]|nr:hypothetical protein SCDLUD_004868 [Saccharomycodes ludwigii]KAH3899425.1 hypothetical protein SCDLUD_004868 [Saccharomycodes ludwigii]